MLATIAPVMTPEQLVDLQRQAATVHVSDALLDYLQNLISATRTSGEFAEGLSPRAALAWLAGARAWAMLEGRDRVLPEDIQAVAVAVLAHRLVPAKQKVEGRADLVRRLLESVPIP
jgi:MoxR-like ATPase